jgi:hypothetical protein
MAVLRSTNVILEKPSDAWGWEILRRENSGVDFRAQLRSTSLSGGCLGGQVNPRVIQPVQQFNGPLTHHSLKGTGFSLYVKCSQ